MYKVLVAPTTQPDHMTLQASMSVWDSVYKELIAQGKIPIARTLARTLADATGPTTARRITVSQNIATVILDAAGVSF